MRTKTFASAAHAAIKVTGKRRTYKDVIIGRSSMSSMTSNNVSAVDDDLEDFLVVSDVALCLTPAMTSISLPLSSVHMLFTFSYSHSVTIIGHVQCQNGNIHMDRYRYVFR